MGDYIKATFSSVALFLFAFIVSPLVVANEDSAEQSQLEEVLVTAQKVTQDVQDVPISISVIRGALIETKGAVSLIDLDGVGPNVVLQRLGTLHNTGNFALRGIGYFDADPMADHKVQVLLDGAPHTRNTGILHDQIDIERVEILRGPQGTLFGRGSLAGTISVITQSPGEDPELRTRLVAGDYGTRNVMLRADTGDVLDGALRARLTTSIRNYDGHQRNAFNGNDLGKTDSRMVRLKIDHQSANTHSTLSLYRVQEDLDGIALTNLVQDPGGDADGDVDLVHHDTDGANESTERGITLNSNISILGGTVSVVANAHQSDYFVWLDVDARAGSIPPAAGRNPGLNVNFGYNIDQEQQSLEARYHGARGDRWNFLTGIFLYREKSLRVIQQNIGAPYSATLRYEDSYSPVEARQRTSSAAVFAQTDYHVNDRLSLVVGARVTRDRKTANLLNKALPPPAAQTPPLELETTETWSQPTWRLGANWRPSESVLYYVSASTGFKPGGFNGRATLVENMGPFDAETMTNYEFGVKADLIDNRLRFNASVFVSDYQNLVGLVRRSNRTGRGNESININLGDADISGAEFEASWLVADDLTLDLALGYLDTAWSEFDVDINNDGIVTDNAHLDLLLAPQWSGRAALEYSRAVGIGRLSFNLDGRYQAEYNTSGRSNDSLFVRPSTVKVNSSLSYLWGPNDNSVSLFVKNLTDKRALTIAFDSVFPFATFDPPRIVGIEVQLGI